MANLYETISRLCDEKGINITTMCKDSGASRGSLTDLKMGRKKTLTAETLSKIAVYFGVTVDYLLGVNPLPDRLKRILSDKGITLKELSDKTGLSYNYISDIIRGGREPHLGNLYKIAECLSVPIDYLLGMEFRQEKEPALTKKDEREDPDIRRIERARSNMSLNDRARMMKVLEAAFEDYFNDNYEGQDDDK